jgi:hypothetical protein
MSDNVLRTIQSILQDVIAPDLREIKAQQAAMQQQIDLRFKEVDTRFKAMEDHIQTQVSGLRQEIAIQIGGLRQEFNIQVDGLNKQMSHMEKQLLAAFATSQLQVELTGTKAIVDIRERVAVLESQRESKSESQTGSQRAA